MLALGDELGIPLIRSWLSDMTLARGAVALWRAARIGTNLRLYQQYFLPVGEHTAVLSEMIASGDPQNWGAIIPGEIGDLWQEAQQVEEDEQIMRFGVLMYNRLTGIARRGRLQTMGPERVFGYLWGLLGGNVQPQTDHQRAAERDRPRSPQAPAAGSVCLER